MFSLDRLSDDSGCIELDFLEWETIFKQAMKLGLRLYLARWLVSSPVSMFKSLVVNRWRSIVTTGYPKQPSMGQPRIMSRLAKP